MVVDQLRKAALDGETITDPVEQLEEIPPKILIDEQKDEMF